MTTPIHDNRRCQLGEGPLWHPERQQFFWLDILQRKLLTQTLTGPQEWQFDEMVSAAGWIDDTALLIASASGLWRFNLTDGARAPVAPLEQDNPVTRSNDGRADPWGGFWIGTMGIHAEAGAGAIYRLYQGQLRKLFGDITISNAICFAPDRSTAYFTDTATGKVMQVALDRAGWPAGAARVFLDLTTGGLNPDGAVVDKDGVVWIALWGAGRVAAYSAAGDYLRAVTVPATQTTCPAFGGADMTTLMITSATYGLPQPQLDTEPEHGKTFVIDDVAQGLPEPKVVL